MNIENYISRKEPCLTGYVQENRGKLYPYDGLFVRELKFECDDNSYLFILQGCQILWEAVIDEYDFSFFGSNMNKVFDYIYPSKLLLKKIKKVKKFKIDAKQKNSYLMLLENHVDAYEENHLNVMEHIMRCNCMSAYQNVLIQINIDNITNERITNIVLDSYFLYNFLKKNFVKKVTLLDKIKQWKSNSQSKEQEYFML